MVLVSDSGDDTDGFFTSTFTAGPLRGIYTHTERKLLSVKKNAAGATHFTWLDVYIEQASSEIYIANTQVLHHR